MNARNDRPATPRSTRSDTPESRSATHAESTGTTPHFTPENYSASHAERRGEGYRLPSPLSPPLISGERLGEADGAALLDDLETRLKIAEATNRVLTELIYELVSQTLPAATKETRP